jgi:hypothetical protein
LTERDLDPGSLRAGKNILTHSYTCRQSSDGEVTTGAAPIGNRDRRFYHLFPGRHLNKDRPYTRRRARPDRRLEKKRPIMPPRDLGRSFQSTRAVTTDRAG